MVNIFSFWVSLSLFCKSSLEACGGVLWVVAEERLWEHVFFFSLLDLGLKKCLRIFPLGNAQAATGLGFLAGLSFLLVCLLSTFRSSADLLPLSPASASSEAGGRTKFVIDPSSIASSALFRSSSMLRSRLLRPGTSSWSGILRFLAIVVIIVGQGRCCWLASCRLLKCVH